MITGVNSNTAQNLQLGAGVVLKEKYVAGTDFKDYILSATNGGATFSAVQNYWTPSVDGISENTKGMRQGGYWTVTLTFTAVEASADVLKKALGCVDVDSETGVITGRHTIKPEDYENFYFVAEKSNGDVIQITIKNALNTSGLNLTTANNGNGGIAFTITGHYDLDDLDTPPFEIETIASESDETEPATEPTTEPTTNNGGVQG